jgi:hypothetical protein
VVEHSQLQLERAHGARSAPEAVLQLERLQLERSESTLPSAELTTSELGMRFSSELVLCASAPDAAFAFTTPALSAG